MQEIGIDAMVMWTLLSRKDCFCLEEPEADYDGFLDGLAAGELLALIEKAKHRLNILKASPTPSTPVHLFIDKDFSIRVGKKDGWELPFRPMVKSLFILFLRHPEGIVLKQRAAFREELESIYGTIAPGVSMEKIHSRVERLVDPGENAFSENASLLNAKLEALFPDGRADSYKIQGHNGHPRKISLNPIYVHWST